MFCLNLQLEDSHFLHSLCYVRIDDDKWNIHGIYVANPTDDCLNPTINGKVEERPQGFAEATIKHEDFIKTNDLIIDTLKGSDLEGSARAEYSTKRLIKFFTEQDKEKNQQKVEELLNNPTEIDAETTVRAYIASLISKGLSNEEMLKIIKSKRNFVGTGSRYSATGVNV